MTTVQDARPGAHLIVDRLAHRIGGEWVEAGGPPIAVEDPATGAVVAHVGGGTAAEADRAVATAVAAGPGWAAAGVEHRAEVVRAIGDLLSAHAEDLAGVVTTEMGMPHHIAVPAQIQVPAQVLRLTADAAASYPWSEPTAAGEILRVPAGVVVAITPWNMPLHQIAAKVGPALVAGCTVVLKPSEIAPLNAFAFVELAEAAGLPPGVLNVVTGTGPGIGEALVREPRVAVVSLTGSLRSGARVSELAAPAITRVCLELGGKSANVLLDDAPLDDAVPSAVAQAFYNSGQACNALTRLVVPEHLHDEVCDRLVTQVGGLTVGDPWDPATDLGPLVSARQLESVRGYVARAAADGAHLLVGGAEPCPHLGAGHYHRPTVFTGVDPASALAREEVFGPVLAVLTHRGDDDAVALANDSDHGLAAGVWSSDRDRARAVGRRIRAGQVKVNGVRTRDSLDAPFGGFGRSGLGRELGPHGIDEYVELVSLLG